MNWGQRAQDRLSDIARCSVDGERAVQMKEVKKIFQNCVFHSQYHIKADLAETDREDLAWIKMGCNKTQHS